MVDYRALSRGTVRKVFPATDSDQVKAPVAGNRYVSVGDLKEGFNHFDSEPDSAEKMAVLVASGVYLPMGLTFAPTNDPEGFQELATRVSTLVSRRPTPSYIEHVFSYTRQLDGRCWNSDVIR